MDVSAAPDYANSAGEATIPRLAAVTLVYAASAVLGLQWAPAGAGSPVWPAAGVAFAALLLGGLRLWPAIFLGRLSAAMIVASPQPLWADAIIAVGNTLAAVIPVLVLRRSGGLDHRVPTLRDALRLLLIGAALGGAIAATIGSFAVWLTASAAGFPSGSVWLVWATGNFVGVATLGVLLLVWSGPDARCFSKREIGHLVLALIASLAVAWIAFTTPEGEALKTWHVYPALIWLALAFQVRGASLGLVFCAAAAVYGTSIGLGPFSELEEDAGARVALLQQFLVVASATILLLGATADERRKKEALERSEKELFEANAAKEVLLHEVNHRVKNSLQVVVGLLALQTDKAKDSLSRTVLENARLRVSVVAALHQRLYKTSAHDHVDFAGFARELAESTMAAVGPEEASLRFESEGEVILPISQAVPLALVVSELLTNAAKHGSPAIGQSQIRVQLKRENAALVLTVTDNGRGLPSDFDLGGSSGLGMTISNGLVKQLRAKLTARNTGEGSEFVVTLPIDEQAQP